jgi:ABC-2 type transport system ATP-binding protein
VASAVANGPAGEGWTDWTVSLAPGAEPGDLLQACTAQGFALRGFDLHKPSLHEVFLHLVGPGQEVVQ